MTDKDLYTEIPSIRVYRSHCPGLYDRLSRMGRRDVEGLVLHALERSRLADTEDRDYTLATIRERLDSLCTSLGVPEEPLGDIGASVSLLDALRKLARASVRVAIIRAEQANQSRAEIEARDREIKRLKEHLRRIAFNRNSPSSDDNGGDPDYYAEFAETVARAALAGKTLEEEGEEK